MLHKIIPTDSQKNKIIIIIPDINLLREIRRWEPNTAILQKIYIFQVTYKLSSINSVILSIIKKKKTSSQVEFHSPKQTKTSVTLTMEAYQGGVQLYS